MRQNDTSASRRNIIDTTRSRKPTMPRSPNPNKPKTVSVARPPSLADHLRRAARASGLSVNRVAQEAGLDQSALNRFLNGTRDNLRLDVADRLFQAAMCDRHTSTNQ
jgi:hypothetical protein